MTLVNTQRRLAARPVGLAKPTDWTFTEEEVPSPADGELLVRVEYLSVRPGTMDASEDGEFDAGHAFVAVLSLLRRPS